MTTLYLAVPCYNEEQVLPITALEMRRKMTALIDAGRVSPQSRVVFIDDGSHDRTWPIIEGLHQETPLFSGLKLSRNRGHQNALLCGLMTLKNHADAVISIDADMQDSLDAIDEMLSAFEQGADVVYGVRNKRDTDTFFKRLTAVGFYKILNRMGAKVIFNHSDFRLMSKRALLALAEFEETNIFLRGMVPMLGFKSAVVTYDRQERAAGESKYPMRKMLSLALEGLTSLSIKPIRLITGLGLVSMLISLVMLVVFLVQYFMGLTVPGWPSLIISIWALCGLQLFCMGILGEYIGKIYLETKRRPRYMVETFLNEDS